MKKSSILFTALFCIAVSQPASAKACFDPHIRKTYEIGETYTMLSSWYGPGFNGRPTASGKKFNQSDATMVAHKVLPFGTTLLISNPKTGEEIVATVYDDGPHIAGRHIDVSAQAAHELRFKNSGTAKLQVKILSIPNKGTCRT